MKRGNLDTETDVHTGRTPCEDGGRGQDDAPADQETLKIVRKSPEARTEAWNRVSLGALRRNQPC